MRSFVRFPYLAKLFISAWILVENFICNSARRDADTSYRLIKINLSFANFNYASLILVIMIHSPVNDDLTYQFYLLLVVIKSFLGLIIIKKFITFWSISTRALETNEGYLAC